MLTHFVELNCTVTQLALAWLAAQNLVGPPFRLSFASLAEYLPQTSTIILGASKPEQILDNVTALDVIPKITPAVNHDILSIMDAWDPTPAVRRGFTRALLAAYLMEILQPRYRDDPMPQGQLLPLGADNCCA